MTWWQLIKVGTSKRAGKYERGLKKGFHPVNTSFELSKYFCFFDAELRLGNGGAGVKQNLLTLYHILYKYYSAHTIYSDFMILVITGNGKGKTTSALGTALRACGWGKKVVIAFFDKGGSHYGEENTLNLLQEKIDILRFGLPRFDEQTETFRFESTPEDIKEAKKGLKAVKELLLQEYFFVVADELITCLNVGLLDEADVQGLVADCPEGTHLILTGRNCPDWLREKADLVSEINDEKHYFSKGQGAIKGLDY